MGGDGPKLKLSCADVRTDQTAGSEPGPGTAVHEACHKHTVCEASGQVGLAALHARGVMRGEGAPRPRVGGCWRRWAGGCIQTLRE